jgi:MoaA/NifB/PqqE/SkfB family radical SAM enzyme
MNIPHPKFCVLPWVSLEASPIGTVRPCCLADEEISNDQGIKFQLATADFDQVRNSNQMQQLRQDFLDGKQPSTCRKCWREEDSGRTSKRMHTLDRLKHMIPDQEWTIDSKPLMFLDLKLGNICNLKCRICGSWSSSTYAVEEISHQVVEKPKESFHYQMLKQGRWPRENTVFWEQIADSVDQLQYIEFTGGEPFMIQEHFDFLQRLVDQGVAKNIEIHYNTNGTQYPDHAEEIWRHFKTVEIAFSIDDVGARFEYQRSGAEWESVLKNIKLFKDMRARCSNIQLQVCTTVNVFNVYYLEEVAQWIMQQNFDFVYWNMMHEAYYFSISTLPSSAKQAISKHLQQANVPDPVRRDLSQIINFMNNGQSLDGSELREKIQQVDQRRAESLRTVAPELADLIDYK